MRMEESLVDEVQPYDPDSDAREEGGWVVEEGERREEPQYGSEEGVHCDDDEWDGGGTGDFVNG